MSASVLCEWPGFARDGSRTARNRAEKERSTVMDMCFLILVEGGMAAFGVQLETKAGGASLKEPRKHTHTPHKRRLVMAKFTEAT